MHNHDAKYWDWRISTAETQEEFQDAVDGMLSSMVDAGQISMSWDDEVEEFVFFMTNEQRKLHDHIMWGK
jgi:hypothetical protein